jgi:hypothetical protein
MRVQRENRPPEQGFGTGFDTTDRRIAIFYRERKVAGHERGTHPFELALWHAAAQDERLGATAKRAIKGAYAHFVRRRGCKAFLAYFGMSGPAIPERLGNFGILANRQFLKPRSGIVGYLPCYTI